MADFFHSKKAANLTVCVVFVVSVTGFFIGMRQTLTETESPAPAPAASLDDHGPHAPSHAPQAVDYRELRSAGLGPNAHFQSNLTSLRAPEGMLQASMAELRLRREDRRAFDGAPPVVPHPIAQDNSFSCLACHQEATRIDDVVAPGISHPAYASCTQCHVSTRGLGSQWNTGTYQVGPFDENSFSGHHQPAMGSRAYPDAAPTIPHTIHMRQNCNSCHGPLGTSPIRTTHPERQSCMQCHIPGGGVDKRNFGESPFPFIPQLAE